MTTIDLVDGATVAQLNEAERIQARKGACLIRLDLRDTGRDRVLMHIDVLGDTPMRTVAGRPLPYMTITLLPNGRPCHVEAHDVDLVGMKKLDETVLAELSTHPAHWWTAPEVARALSADYDRVRASLTRLIDLSMIQHRGSSDRRTYRHAETWH